jgi:hypothetical protein
MILRHNANPGRMKFSERTSPDDARKAGGHPGLVPRADLAPRHSASETRVNANRSQREARTAFFAMAAGLVPSRPLLMSNCAPDRLRRLSVDADKCPSHVFRVTEPDRLRDAFDRFDSRLYPASG